MQQPNAGSTRARSAWLCPSLYTVILWKTSASVLQGLKLANGSGEEKVQTTHQTALSVLLHECETARGNVHDIFHISSFLLILLLHTL